MEHGRAETRAESLLVALSEASLAASRATSPRDVYRGAAEALKRQGFDVNIYVSQPDGSARLEVVTYAPDLMTKAEKLTGMKASDFVITPEGAPVFHDLFIDGRASFMVGTGPLLRHILPGDSAVQADAIARLLGIGSLLAAPIRTEERIIGAIFILGDDCTPRDLPALESFSHLLGITASRAALLTRHQASLERLDETQARLLHAQKLETLGLLTAGIAHDVNNLLTPGVFAVDLLRPMVPDKGQRWLSAIEDTLKRTAALTGQLLAAGARQQLQVAAVDLDGMVLQAIKLLRPALGEAVVIELDLGCDGGTVQGDKSQLEQVLFNLVVNARDALPPGGHIHVSTGLQTHDGVAGAVMQVRDDGTGMDEQTLRRALEPFFTTKPSGVGSGLGLAMTEGIVTQHAGHLTLTSQLGQGTTVAVWLPLGADGSPMPLPPLQPVQPDLTGHAWVLEDRPLVRSLVATALRDCGATVTEAATLAQADQLLASPVGPQLIVSDIVLPDGFGVDFVEQVHARWPDVVVLFISGHPMDDDVARRVEAIAGRYLAKPFTRDQLMTSVAAALGQWAMMGR